jgi:MauM/NapG family ferredoxin protein
MPAKRIQGCRVIRWPIQAAFLALFVFLFLRTRYGVSAAFQDVFFRFDPLVLLVTSIALRTVVAAALLGLVLIAGTLLFGRFFCGFACPLGTSIDLFDAATRRKAVKGSRLRNGKYLILIFLIVAALVGASFAGFFDPVVIMGRSLALVFFPAGTRLVNLLQVTKVARYAELPIALATWVVILALGFVASRFWCRNLCPLGGLLALFAKFSLFRFAFEGRCRDCGICEKVCPTGAITAAKRQIDSAECIDCLACLSCCPDRSIRYRVRFAPVPFDAGRREAILALGSGLVLAPLAATLIRPRVSERLIRPPGSIPEPQFLAACIRCGRCLKACPTGGLQPCVFEAGVPGLWTPRLVPRAGPCERNCTMCGQVCPTSAIRKLPLEEKTFARIGTAVIDRTRCIAWEQNKVCLICDETCPYNAIDALRETLRGAALLRPFVNERYCLGCGACESRCPVAGPAAIRVFSAGEDRRRAGSYKAGGKVRQRVCGETPGEDVPSGFIPE